jgi:hypothetical protein
MKNKTIRIFNKSKNRSKTKSKNRGKSKSKSNKGKNQKGGLFNMSFGLNGENLFGKTYGKKIYDHDEGKWKDQPCTKFFGLEYCETAKD